MISLLMLFGGLVLTLLAAGWMVDGASSIAKKLNISDLVIGLTIVSLGTSTPELAINIFSAIKGSTELAIGNVLGSNIANILLILGVSAMVTPLTVTSNTTWKEIPFSLLAALALGFMVNDKWLDPGMGANLLSRNDGLVLLCFLAIFMVYTFEIARLNKDEGEQVEMMTPWKSVLFVVVGIAGLFLGGKLLVDGAVALALMAGISERVIGLTIVAIGTSLPELATSVVAARKGKSDIAVGNVVGSNILNIFLILGVTSLIHPMEFQADPSNHDLGLVILASFILFVTTFYYSPKRIDRREGFFFLMLYILYLISLIFI